MSEFHTQALEARARRAAQAAGYRAIKSRRLHPLENKGGFKILAPSGFPMAGFCFDMTPEEVIAWCRN